MQPSDFLIDLGATAVDSVTGFKGFVTGRAQYITGCNQYSLTPKVGADGKIVDGAWFDENRLTVDDKFEAPEIKSGSPRGGPVSNMPSKG